jgi:uncharacterized membrane protein
MDEQNNTNENNSPKTDEVIKIEAPSKENLWAILCYLGILIIIPFFIAKNNSFVRFHIKQGLVLLALSFVAWLLDMIHGSFSFVYNIINIAVFIFAIIGIINVVKNKEKELPFVGEFSKYFKF